MKVILDTSVFCAALKSRSPSSLTTQIMLAWRRGAITLVMAPQLLEELVCKLIELGISEDVVEELVIAIQLLCHHIPGVYETTYLDEIDPNDNMFLAAAYEAKADYLVSRDAHLLNQKYFYGTQIVDPPIFWRVLNQKMLK